MDGKEQIIQKILLDAQTAAQKKINSANVKAEETVSKAKFDAEKEFDEAKAVVDKNAELYLSRNNTAALMEQKRRFLGAKQQMIDDVYAVVLKKLSDMGKDDYLRLVESKIKQYAEKGDEIIISENAPFTAEELLNLDVCKNLALTAVKNGKFSGGIVLNNAVCDKNLTFDTLVEELKTRTEAEVAVKLFN